MDKRPDLRLALGQRNVVLREGKFFEDADVEEFVGGEVHARIISIRGADRQGVDRNVYSLLDQ